MPYIAAKARNFHLRARSAAHTSSEVCPQLSLRQALQSFRADQANSIGGQVHIRLRSPYGLSMRPTCGQNLVSFNHGAGQAAC